jgi:hypothetical protein
MPRRMQLSRLRSRAVAGGPSGPYRPAVPVPQTPAIVARSVGLAIQALRFNAQQQVGDKA